MKVTETLIHKFFADKCSDVEAELVLAYFKEHPSELDLYIPKKEWDAIGTSENSFGSKEELEKIEALIEQRRQALIITRRKAKHKMLRHYAAAAAIILLVMVTAGHRHYPGQVIDNKTVTGGTTDVNLLTDTIIYNDALAEKRLLLPDGSKVAIASKSVIHYEKNFQAKTRDIYLQGRASFWVARNKERPFIVHSGHLTTTALGTSFSVTAYDSAATIKVVLFTGKVLIRSAAGTRVGTKNTYLLPGDSMEYDVISGASAVEKHSSNTKTLRTQLQTTVGEDLRIEEDERMIEFNQVDLSVVLQKLKGIYHTNFIYDPAILKGKSFTGVIKKKRSKEMILENIAAINNLMITPVEGGYLIRKKSQ